MAQNNMEKITPDNVNLWLSSVGFLFPHTEADLKNEEKLFENFDYELSGNEIEPDIILSGLKEGVAFFYIKPTESKAELEWKMAARNFGSIPQHIVDKMKKNQNKNDGTPDNV